jgi:hypothetical protein
VIFADDGSAKKSELWRIVANNHKLCTSEQLTEIERGRDGRKGLFEDGELSGTGRTDQG